MQERKKPETLRLKSVTPSMTVKDLAASRDWYRDVLGAIITGEYHHEDRLVGVGVKAGQVEFMLGQDDFAKGRDRVKGVGFRLYCLTSQDVDQVAADIKARGGKLDEDPGDRPWGSRDFSITDPDGYKISISSRSSD